MLADLMSDMKMDMPVAKEPEPEPEPEPEKKKPKKKRVVPPPLVPLTPAVPPPASHTGDPPSQESRLPWLPAESATCNAADAAHLPA